VGGTKKEGPGAGSHIAGAVKGDWGMAGRVGWRSPVGETVKKRGRGDVSKVCSVPKLQTLGLRGSHQLCTVA